jgi:amino acid permease
MTDDHIGGEMELEEDISTEPPAHSTAPIQVDQSGLPLFSDDLPPAIDVGPDGLPTIVPTVPEEEEDSGEADVSTVRVRRFATIMNVLNSMFGAGILGIPHSVIHCGILPSLVLMFGIAALSYLGTIMVLSLARRRRCADLGQLGYDALGRFGGIGISVGVMVYCISCQVAYLVIGIRTICGWFSLGGIEAPRMIVLLCYSAIPIGRTLPRQIGFLSLLSTTTFGLILFFVISLIIQVSIMFTTDQQWPTYTYATFDSSVFSALSVHALSFALPVVVLPLMRPYNTNAHKQNIVSIASIGTCLTVVVATAIFGYLRFGDAVEAVVLDSFEQGDVLMEIVRSAFCVVVTGAYVCVGQSVMASWAELIFRDANQGMLPTGRRLVVLLCANAPPLLLALFLPKAGPALLVGGAFGGCIVDFFFPALMWIKVADEPVWYWKNLLCLLMADFGVATAAIATYQAVMDAIKAFGS